MFAWIIAFGQLIWTGIQAATTATVAFLASAVQVIWNVLRAAGSLLARVGHHVWEFFRATWDHVLKPAWEKFFKFVDRVHDWMEKHIAPALRKLNALRKRIQGWWKKYVRPVLDVIEVTRRVLRVAASLHIPFAHALDVELGKIEEKIEKPYRLLLSKLNEVINFVNRVITLDGLFQRVALIRSLERDFKFAWQAMVNPYSSPVTDADRKRRDDKHAVKSLPTIADETRAYMRDHSGPRAPLLDEMRIIWRKQLRAQ